MVGHNILKNNKCCSWKLLLSLIGIIQILIILGYQGFFSFTKLWNVAPVEFFSQKIGNFNIHIHQIGLDSWKFSDNDKIYNAGSFNQGKNNLTVDIHHENVKYGHAWDDIHSHNDQRIQRNSIAMGMGITSRKTKWKSTDEIKKSFPFFRSLLPSFCKTASPGFSYNFFMAYDKDDAFYTRFDNLLTVQKIYLDFVEVNCPKLSNYSIHFVQCSHRKQPARAQNDAMMAAYMSNMEFYYRINDDTKMKSSNWTNLFIAKLKSFDPPYVGVVGPKHKGGNTAILTYDFVHYTHIHIHGFYYPRPLTDWFADRWITDVYKPSHCVKLSNVHLDHTMESGQRYAHHANPSIKKKLTLSIQTGKAVIKRYIEMWKKDVKIKEENVLAFSLAGQNPKYTYGAIRNAQLWPVIFPNWKLRIYALDPAITKANISEEFLVPSQIINKLKLLGADFIFLNETFAAVPPSLWKYLVTDDNKVQHFLVRNTEQRINEKDYLLTEDWLQKANTHSLFCVRDKINHKGKSLVDGLFGAQNVQFKNIFKNNMGSVIYNFSVHRKDLKDVKDNAELIFLNTIIWPRLVTYNQTSCYDSVSENSSIAQKIPDKIAQASVNFTKLGTFFNEFEEEIS